MYQWAESGSIPELTRWGWLGTRIMALFNNLYAQRPHEISDEIDCIGTTACALADIVLHMYPDFRQEGVELLDAIDKGELGVKVNNKRYLTAAEFLAVHCE